MNRYCKYISTLIKNWLLKNGCVLVYESKSSESKYYTYRDIKIRIAYHIPNSCYLNSIYILIPVNNKPYFGIFIGKQFCSVSSLKELKSFIKAIFLVLDIDVFINGLFKDEKIKQFETLFSEKDEKIKKLETKIGNLNIQLRDQKKRIDNQTTQLRIFQNKKQYNENAWKKSAAQICIN